MSVASASQYGPYIDLQSYNGGALAAPATSGSIYLTGSAASERVRINVGLLAPKLKLASSTEVASVLDEDNMASNSATALATQQSIKAYVDSQVTAQDLDFQGDSGTGAVDLDSQTLDIAGGTGLSTVASGQTLTVNVNGVLEDLNTLGAASADGEFIVATGAGAFAYESGATARTSLGLGTGDSPQFTGLTLTGDLTVQGTTTTLDTTVVQVEDPVMQINYTGGAAGAQQDGGIHVGRTGATDASLIWDHSNSVWAAGLAGAEIPLVATTATQTLTNKTLTSPDINGGTVDAITSLTAAGDLDIGAHDFRAATLTADGLTAGRVVFAGTNGVLSDDSDFSFSTDTLTVTKIGAFEAAGAINFASQAMTNVDINSGAVDGTVIGAASAAAGTFTALVGTSLSVSDGNITNVGDIALDSISADGTELDIELTDNITAALEIKEGSNVYMAISTANSAEAIAFGKAVIPASDDAIDLGSSTKEWKDLYIDGTANIDNLSVDSVASRLQVQDTTEATTTSDGSIYTRGGLSVTKSAVIGDDLDLLSDGAILNIGSTSKFTLTDQSANNCAMVTANHRLAFGSAAEYVAGDGDDLLLVSGEDIISTPAQDFVVNAGRKLDVNAAAEFSSTVTVGASTAGADVTFYGTNANDLMLWDASENALVVKDGGSEIVRMGGDATTDYAIDVGAGSAGSNNINKIRASAFVTFSDERLKSDVEPMRNALDTVNSLSAVNFTWKEGGARDFGFMAQDLQKVIPQAVHGTDEGMFGVDYGRLTAVLVSAIQEQSAQIKDLQAKLNKK